MVPVSKSSLPEFLAQRPFAVVHVDAQWDGYRLLLEKKIGAIEPQFQNEVSFGYVDCDQEQEYAREIGIVNVPSMAYYRDGELTALVVGVQQDLAENIRRVMQGEVLDTSNKLSRG